MAATPATQLPLGHLLFSTQNPQQALAPIAMTIKVRYLVLPPNEMLHQGTILNNHNWHSHREELPLLIVPTCTQGILPLAPPLCRRCQPSAVKQNHSTSMHMMIAVCMLDTTLTLLRKTPLHLPTFPVSLLNLQMPASKCHCTLGGVVAGSRSSLLMGLLLEEGATKQVLCPHVSLLQEASPMHHNQLSNCTDLHAVGLPTLHLIVHKLVSTMHHVHSLVTTGLIPRQMYLKHNRWDLLHVFTVLMSISLCKKHSKATLGSLCLLHRLHTPPRILHNLVKEWSQINLI